MVFSHMSREGFGNGDVAIRVKTDTATGASLLTIPLDKMRGNRFTSFQHFGEFKD